MYRIVPSIAALLLIVKNWGKKTTSNNWKMNKQIVELSYYGILCSNKKNALLIYRATQTHFKNISLSETSQTHNDTHSMIPFI